MAPGLASLTWLSHVSPEGSQRPSPTRADVCLWPKSRGSIRIKHVINIKGFSSLIKLHFKACAFRLVCGTGVCDGQVVSASLLVNVCCGLHLSLNITSSEESSLIPQTGLKAFVCSHNLPYFPVFTLFVDTLFRFVFLYSESVRAVFVSVHHWTPAILKYPCNLTNNCACLPDFCLLGSIWILSVASAGHEQNLCFCLYQSLFLWLDLPAQFLFLVLQLIYGTDTEQTCWAPCFSELSWPKFWSCPQPPPGAQVLWAWMTGPQVLSDPVLGWETRVG